MALFNSSIQKVLTASISLPFVELCETDSVKSLPGVVVADVVVDLVVVDSLVVRVLVVCVVVEIVVIIGSKV